MSLARVMGAFLVVAAVAFLVMGFQHVPSMSDELGKLFTGDFRDGPTWLILASVVAAILGIVALTRPHRPFVGEE